MREGGEGRGGEGRGGDTSGSGRSEEGRREGKRGKGRGGEGRGEGRGRKVGGEVGKEEREVGKKRVEGRKVGGEVGRGEGRGEFGVKHLILLWYTTRWSATVLTVGTTSVGAALHLAPTPTATTGGAALACH